MKYIEHFYKDKEKYKEEMSKYSSLKKGSVERYFYRLREYIKEGKYTLDELKHLVDIQHLKLIMFYDMRRLKDNVSEDDLLTHGFDYDDIQKLKGRELI